MISDCNFDVHTPGRIYHFELSKGEDKTEMQKWIDGFSQFLIKNEKDNEQLHQNGEKEGLVPMKGWLRKFGGCFWEISTGRRRNLKRLEEEILSTRRKDVVLFCE